MSESFQADLASLDVESRKELMAWLETENSKSKFQQSIHKFNDLCFKRCIDKIEGPMVTPNEEQCLKGCLHRFLDTNTKVVNK